MQNIEPTGWSRPQDVLARAVTVLSAALPDPLAALHPREREVLGQVALGRRNRDIAPALHISESTVKSHVANILGKLGAGSRGEAAAPAHSAGLSPVRPLRAVSGVDANTT
jgi:DNA-binding NarL/FixJ family response regulator